MQRSLRRRVAAWTRRFPFRKRARSLRSRRRRSKPSQLSRAESSYNSPQRKNALKLFKQSDSSFKYLPRTLQRNSPLNSSRSGSVHRVSSIYCLLVFFSSMWPNTEENTHVILKGINKAWLEIELQHNGRWSKPRRAQYSDHSSDVTCFPYLSEPGWLCYSVKVMHDTNAHHDLLVRKVTDLTNSPC